MCLVCSRDALLDLDDLTSLAPRISRAQSVQEFSLAGHHTLRSPSNVSLMGHILCSLLIAMVLPASVTWTTMLSAVYAELITSGVASWKLCRICLPVDRGIGCVRRAGSGESVILGTEYNGGQVAALTV
jgi:hypothetical protein